MIGVRGSQVKEGFAVNSNSHFDPERGCVVPTSRSTPGQSQEVRRLHALRLMLRTQPRSAK
jgi:hypothetical protein